MEANGVTQRKKYQGRKEERSCLPKYLIIFCLFCCFSFCRLLFAALLLLLLLSPDVYCLEADSTQESFIMQAWIIFAHFPIAVSILGRIAFASTFSSDRSSSRLVRNCANARPPPLASGAKEM